MPKLKFRYDGEATRTFEDLLRVSIDEEYFRGELFCRSIDAPHMSVEQSSFAQADIHVVTTRSRVAFRRALKHIRANDKKLYLVWFVYQGSMQMTGPEGTQTINAGNLVAISSEAPFVADFIPGGEGVVHAMTINIPSTVMDIFIPDRLRLGIGYEFDDGELNLCEQLFALLFRTGENLDPLIAEKMVETALMALRRGAETSQAKLQRSTLPKMRMDQALHYIDRNLHNPAISARLIAKECHMSVRYLHHLLAANNTSLGALIRTRRLSRAAEWLSAADMRTVPVSQISYMAGFKNPEHFSRAFKATLGASPSQFRRALNGQLSSKSAC